MKFALVIEQADNNYSAYVPDLPGCIATGVSIQDAQDNIRSAIEFHLEGMKLDGDPVPEPSSAVDYVEVAA